LPKEAEKGWEVDIENAPSEWVSRNRKGGISIWTEESTNSVKSVLLHCEWGEGLKQAQKVREGWTLIDQSPNERKWFLRKSTWQIIEGEKEARTEKDSQPYGKGRKATPPYEVIKGENGRNDKQMTYYRALGRCREKPALNEGGGKGLDKGDRGGAGSLKLEAGHGE